MPRIPKWIGDAMESVLASKYLHVTVLETEYLTPQLKRVRFEGDLAHTDFQTGYVVSLRVNDADYRHYTLLRFNKQEGDFEIFFHLHGSGPGSGFAERLKNGDQLKMVIPRGKKMFREDSSWHFFSGDETALGLFTDIKEAAGKQGGLCTGILELDARIPVPDSLRLAPYITDKNNPDKTAEMLACLQDIKEDMGDQWPNMTCYLAGNAASIQRVRKALLEQGISSRNILTQAYWATGKTGL